MHIHAPQLALVALVYIFAVEGDPPSTEGIEGAGARSLGDPMVGRPDDWAFQLVTDPDMKG
jgi:hypothetical protein